MNAKQKRRQSAMASVRERAATRKSRIKPQTERYNRVMLERRERALRPAAAAPKIERGMDYLGLRGKNSVSSNKPKWKDRSGYRAK